MGVAGMLDYRKERRYMRGRRRRRILLNSFVITIRTVRALFRCKSCVRNMNAPSQPSTSKSDRFQCISGLSIRMTSPSPPMICVCPYLSVLFSSRVCSVCSSGASVLYISGTQGQVVSMISRNRPVKPRFARVSAAILLVI